MRYLGLNDDLPHKMKLFVAIGKQAQDISIVQTIDVVSSYDFGPDMTGHELQAAQNYCFSVTALCLDAWQFDRDRKPHWRWGGGLL